MTAEQSGHNGQQFHLETRQFIDLLRRTGTHTAYMKDAERRLAVLRHEGFGTRPYNPLVEGRGLDDEHFTRQYIQKIATHPHLNATLIMGAPSSGKSTIAQEIAAACEKMGIDIRTIRFDAERDKIMKKYGILRGGTLLPEHWREMSDACTKKAKEEMRKIQRWNARHPDQRRHLIMDIVAVGDEQIEDRARSTAKALIKDWIDQQNPDASQVNVLYMVQNPLFPPEAIEERETIVNTPDEDVIEVLRQRGKQLLHVREFVLERVPEYKGKRIPTAVIGKLVKEEMGQAARRDRIIQYAVENDKGYEEEEAKGNIHVNQFKKEYFQDFIPPIDQDRNFPQAGSQYDQTAPLLDDVYDRNQAHDWEKSYGPISVLEKLMRDARFIEYDLRNKLHVPKGAGEAIVTPFSQGIIHIDLKMHMRSSSLRAA